MGDLVVTEFVSMDGVMQAPGGEDFKYGNWSFDFDRGDDGGEFKAKEVYDSEAQLIGRVTYDSFADAWPKYEEESDFEEFAKYFNEMKHFVVSSTLEDPEWTNTEVIDGSGDVPAAIRKLKDDVDGQILVSGSRTLVQTLLENDLVDRVRLMVFPTVLGTGDRVFGEYSNRTDWELEEAKPVGPDGVLTLDYRRKR